MCFDYMTYNIKLADRVREYLAEIPNLEIEEKEMFSVLNFMVNGKTCICVRGEDLMLRFDPALQEELAEKCGTNKGYISKIENNIKEVRISTLQKIVELGLGGRLELNIKL